VEIKKKLTTYIGTVERSFSKNVKIVKGKKTLIKSVLCLQFM